MKRWPFSIVIAEDCAAPGPTSPECSDPSVVLRTVTSIGQFKWLRVAASILVTLVGMVTHAQDRTPAEWLADLAAIDVAESRPDAQLELGCAARTLYSSGGDGRALMIASGSPGLAARTVFDAWRTSTGDGMIDRWRAGTLGPSDPDWIYIWMLRATYLYKYLREGRTNPSDQKSYYDSVISNGETLLKKGFSGGNFTADEITRLREYLIAVDMLNTAGKDTPMALGQTRSYNSPFAPGETTPDFLLPYLETVLARPAYTDSNTTNPVRSFRAEGLATWMRAFQHYRKSGAGTPGDGGAVQPIPNLVRDGEDPAGYFRLSDLRGLHPVVVFPARLIDGYWFNYLGRHFEALHQTYGNDVQFLLVGTRYKDVSAATPVYVGPERGATRPRMMVYTQEDLAFESKQALMRFNYLSMPVLIDDEGFSTLNSLLAIGGDARPLIVDAAGKVAFQANINTIMGSVPVDYAGAALWLNVLELELRLLLANGGAYVDHSEFRSGSLAQQLHSRKGTAARDRVFTLPSGTVTSISGDTFTMSTTVGGASKSYTITLTPRTRLETSNVASDYTGIIASRADLTVGKTVTVNFWEDSYQGATATRTTGNHIRTRVEYTVAGDTGDNHITARMVMISPYNRGRTLWAGGVIKSVNPEQRQIVVEVQPNWPEFRGLNMIAEAESNATIFGEAADHRAVFTAWQQSGTPYTFTLGVDESTEVFLNGEWGVFDDLVVGDRLAFAFIPRQLGQPVIFAEMLRISRPVAVGSNWLCPKVMMAEAVAPDLIRVVFDRMMPPVRIADLSAYALDGGARVLAGWSSVKPAEAYLSTSPLAQGQTYTLTLNRLRDQNDWRIAPDIKVSVTFQPVTLTDWLNGYGLQGATAEPQVDADSDGMTNLQEYMLGLNPATPDLRSLVIDNVERGLPIILATPQGTSCVYQRDLLRTDLQVHPEYSHDLQLWQTVPAEVDLLLRQDGAVQTRSCQIALADGSPLFFRLRGAISTPSTSPQRSHHPN